MKFINKIAPVILALNCLFAYAQHKEKSINLIKLDISDNLKTVLKKIIEEEKQCDYYSCKLIFGISIDRLGNSGDLIIDSMLDKNIALTLRPYGYFYYKSHLFFVDSDTANELLTTTDNDKVFKYLEYDPNYKPKKDEERKVFLFTDDSFSQWEYSFEGRELLLKNKTQACN